MKCIDTTFLIDFRYHNKNLKPLIAQLDKEGIHAVPSIVKHEFLVGGLGSTNKNEIDIRKDLLLRFLILPFDNKSSIFSSKLENKQRHEGNFIGTTDIFIAGTMLSYNIDTILTRNIKYFEKIDGISVISWEK